MPVPLSTVGKDGVCQTRKQETLPEGDAADRHTQVQAPQEGLQTTHLMVPKSPTPPK